MPDFLSARLPGTLDELEAVVARAKRASSLLATANALRTKTTVCRNVAATLQPGRYRVCYVSLTTGNVLDMYKSIGWELGLPTERSRATAYRAIRAEITRLVCEARQLPVLVIDEAQHLRNDVLEDLALRQSRSNAKNRASLDQK